MGIGDWGLGIGDWAQSPIPNTQSTIPNPHYISLKLLNELNKNNIRFLIIYKINKLKLYYKI